MEHDRELGRRLGLGLVVLGLFLVVAYVVKAFIAVVVFAIFLYYSVRPIHRFLRRFGLPRRLRAALSIVLFGIPFVVLLGYTLAIISLEAQSFVQAYDLQTQLLDQVNTEAITGIDRSQLQSALTGGGAVAGASQPLGTVAVAVLGALSIVSSVLVQLLIMLVLTYYMLIDGPRLKEWALGTFDDAGIVRQYVEEVDPELSMTLFGNIVNVFVTAIVAVITYFTYNFFAPAVVAVPYPGLIGALAGIGSLIPVVGIKLVYVPVAIVLGVNAVVAGGTASLLYLGIFLVVSGIFVDFIPDFFIRALISGDKTHTGMLLVSYIVGPIVFGFYGLFLLPMLLILFINANQILLPYVLYGIEPTQRQRTFEEYLDRENTGTETGRPAPSADD